MDFRHILTIASLVLGVLGSLYLSYDLLGKPGGFLRQFVAGVMYGGFVIALIEGFLSFSTLSLQYFGVSFFYDMSSLPFVGWLSLHYQFRLILEGLLGFLIGYLVINTEFLKESDESSFNFRSTNNGVFAITVFVLIFPLLITDTLLGVLTTITNPSHLKILFSLVDEYYHHPLGALISLVLLLLVSAILSAFLSFLSFVIFKVGKVSDRGLGAFGAILTFTAFTIQLGLEIFS